MEIIPKDSSLFRASVEALKEFLPQAILRISNEGIRINGMDTSHVCFIDYLLAAVDCSIINITKPYVIGINMNILSRTLSSVGQGDYVSLSLNKEENKLIISYTNNKISKKVVYEVPMIDINEDIIGIPELAYVASISAKTTDISSIIKEVSHFGDTIVCRLDEDGFHISSEGDAGKVNQTLENTEERDMELTDNFVEASYASKFLLMIMKGGNALSSNTQIEFDPTRPLRATFRFCSTSYFIAYIAPKIIEE
jgi:proliferating cell nuclear antigen